MAGAPDAIELPIAYGLGLVRVVLGLIAVGGLAGLGAWAAIWGLGNDRNAVGSTAAIDLDQGRIVYALQCASCHGPNLEGQANWRERRTDGRLPAPPHDATGHTWHHPDGQPFELTKYGVERFAPSGYRSDMPGFADRLSDGDIRNVLAFVWSTWPAEIQRRQTEASRRQMAQ